MDPSLSDMVTQGANRVGERGEATLSTAVAFGIAVGFTVVVLRARRSRALFGAAVVGVLAAAVPGLATIQERRADSLAHAPLAAAVIERFRGEVQGFAEAHGCATVVRSTCAACDPIVDFALATSRPCPTPAPIVLGADALTAGCRDVRGTLVCGGGERPL